MNFTQKAIALSSAGILSLLAIPTAAQADDPQRQEQYSEALGSLIETDAFAGDPIALGTSTSTYPQLVTPVQTEHTLSTISDETNSKLLPLGVPLVSGTAGGLLTSSPQGSFNSFAFTETATTAKAGAGSLNLSGELSPDKTDMSKLSVDLTKLFNKLSIPDLDENSFDKAQIDFGGLGSVAQWSDGNFSSEYSLSSAKLDLHGHGIEDLYDDLRVNAVNLGKKIDSTTQPGGLLEQITESSLSEEGTIVTSVDWKINHTVEAEKTLQSMIDEVLVSDDRSVLIDLKNGTLEVDLSKVLNSTENLDQLDAGTEILNDRIANNIALEVQNMLGAQEEKIVNYSYAALKDILFTGTVKVSANAPGYSFDGNIMVKGSIAQLIGTDYDSNYNPLFRGNYDTDLDYDGRAETLEQILIDTEAVLWNQSAPITANYVAEMFYGNGALNTLEQDNGKNSRQLVDDLLRPLLEQSVEVSVNEQRTISGEGDNEPAPVLNSISAVSLQLLPDADRFNVNLGNSKVWATTPYVHISSPKSDAEFSTTDPIAIRGISTPDAKISILVRQLSFPDGDDHPPVFDEHKKLEIAADAQGNWTSDLEPLPEGNFIISASSTVAEDAISVNVINRTETPDPTSNPEEQPAPSDDPQQSEQPENTDNDSSNPPSPDKENPDLMEHTKGRIDAPDNAYPGQSITVAVPEVEPGVLVNAWFYSSPHDLGNFKVSKNNTIDIHVPTKIPYGTHSIAVWSSADKLIGWDEIVVKPDSIPHPTDSMQPNSEEEPKTSSSGEPSTSDKPRTQPSAQEDSKSSDSKRNTIENTSNSDEELADTGTSITPIIVAVGLLLTLVGALMTKKQGRRSL